ncbi:YajQ family cyclic di-GMP-binding protein [Anaerobiospirillum thomasii]|uniref:Nucleotide-binding protein NCTC13093_00949 n=1 Tax=Anaerobiospirillum thomasii TaxID=179995 RepID=A0A2X0WVP0_9GAMM|nr:YajQ family cyclic di-GMP-binding protein [Anaerobiospirillum thomasii]SPT69571.1 putative nucleotide-binding protein [Anaerobiospirillum thomasii]
MPSFDVVSEIKKDELQNAIENANRELSTRYDFRGTDAKFEYSKADSSVKLEADEEFQVQQMDEILLSKLVKRNIEVTAADFGEITRSGKKSIQTVTFKQGIDKELGKKIVKKIKDAKIKVDAKMNDDTVRVTGKKRDDLQAVIALLRNEDMGQPLQFNNFRD